MSTGVEETPASDEEGSTPTNGRRQMLVRYGSSMEASAARIRPTATRRNTSKACPTGAGPQTTRSRPLPRAHGKEGVIGSSPMLGLLPNTGDLQGVKLARDS